MKTISTKCVLCWAVATAAVLAVVIIGRSFQAKHSGSQSALHAPTNPGMVKAGFIDELDSDGLPVELVLSNQTLQISHYLKNVSDRDIIIYDLENSIRPFIQGPWGMAGQNLVSKKPRIILSPGQYVFRWIRLDRRRKTKHHACNISVRMEGGIGFYFSSEKVPDSIVFRVGYSLVAFSGKKERSESIARWTPEIKIALKDPVDGGRMSIRDGPSLSGSSENTATSLAQSDNSGDLDLAWGEPVNGLRCGLKVVVTGTNPPVLFVAIQRTSTFHVGVHLGSRLGQRLQHEKFSIHETDQDGHIREVIYGGVFGGILGRPYPFIVDLLPGSVYVLKFDGRLCTYDKPLSALWRPAEGNYSATVRLTTDALVREKLPSALWRGTCVSGPATYSIRQ